jgi:ribosomal-protein-alanine N-acetyltransferase
MCLIKESKCLNHKGTQVLYTERFMLRKFREADLCDVYRNWTSDEEAARYNAWKVHDSEGVTREYLNEWMRYYNKDNYYHWAITDAETSEVIGSISITNINDRRKCCETGYTVSRKLWNQGIATEVLKEVLRYLTEDVGFQKIRAYHDIRNKASGRVMEKAGMKYIRNKKKLFLSFDKIVINCCVYEYDKADNGA